MHYTGHEGRTTDLTTSREIGECPDHQILYKISCDHARPVCGCPRSSTSTYNKDIQKLLGVIIDKNLSWDKQIDAVCLNITRHFILLKLLSKYIDQANMKLYYHSYILPIMHYGCLIWGRCTKTNTLRILKLQKSVSRIILSAGMTTPSQNMFSELNWLTFPKRVQYHSCSMVYKAINDLAPEYISDIFTKVSDSHIRNLCSIDNALLRVIVSTKLRSQYQQPSNGMNSLWTFVIIQALTLLSLTELKIRNEIL